MAELDDNTKWFEADASNTQAPPHGWPAGMLPNQVEPTAQAMMGAIKRFWNRVNGVYTSGGGAGTFAVTPAVLGYPAAYVDGERFVFKADKASRGAAAGGDTLNWNSLGAKKLFKPTTAGFVPLDANDIVVGQRVDSIYDATLDGAAGGFAVLGSPIASSGAPTGATVAYSGFTAPGGWLFANGQAVSRTTYAALFSAITISTTGTFSSGSAVVTSIPSTVGMAVGMPLSGVDVVNGATIASVDSATQITMSQNASNNGTGAAFVVAPWGIGNGSTTYNLPDLRGRAPIGVDNMGGIPAANRITLGGSGIRGTTLGLGGGTELMQVHNHGVSDPQHAHGVADFGHQHHLWSFGLSATPGGAGLAHYNSDRGDGELYTDASGSNIGIQASGTGISIQNAGGGGSQNVQPCALINFIIKT